VPILLQKPEIEELGRLKRFLEAAGLRRLGWERRL
jgi:hypothetical protein